MKKHVLICLVTLLVSVNYLRAQNRPDSFPKQWAAIDSLLWKKSLPKSARQQVEALYKKAAVQKNEAQLIKTLLYTLYIDQQITDKDVNQKIAGLRTEVSKAFSTPQKSLLLLLLARAYNDEYNNNSWAIREREETTGPASTDISTWSAKVFEHTIDSLYQLALSPAMTLQQTSLTAYNAIVIQGNVRYLRPTLYDLLANEILTYYRQQAYRPSTSAEEFRLSMIPEALAPATQFMQHSFTTADSTTPLWHTIRLYQQLLQFHKQDKTPDAFIDLDISRISQARTNSRVSYRDSLYLVALTNITSRYPNEPIAMQAMYLVADFYSGQAALYNPLQDTSHRYDKIKAKNIIDQQLAKSLPDNEGKSNLQQLLDQITSPDLYTQAENINVPGQPFRLLVQYRNIKQLYAKIIRFGALYDTLQEMNLYDKETFNKLLPLPAYQQFTKALPPTYDYQQHAIEVKVDALPAGKYMLIAGNSSNFNSTTDRIAIQYFDVSNISYISHGNDYFVLNRETGQPVAGAKAVIQEKKWDTKKAAYRKIKRQSLTTDQNGRFTVDSSVNNQMILTLYTAGDTLQVKNYATYRPVTNKTDIAPADEAKENAFVSFFTDRSIYRPGQTTHFKGILMTRKGEARLPAVYQSKDSIKVMLYDANGTERDSITLAVNEYGSFAAKFTLPQGGLTGNFSIKAFFNKTDASLGDVDFRVEEYKRPKFQITFDTLQSAYQLNDTIAITGHAKAFAGNAINNANVSFTVMRNTSYPYPWLFSKIRQPYSAPATISAGTATTDASGVFTIRFPARPDSTVSPVTLPVFNFSIEASVTDINGETRENSTAVSVGYRSSVIQLSVPAIAAAGKLTHIPVRVENLAGKRMSADVHIAVYSLQTPDRLIRKRYWQAPDQFEMPYNEFIQYFPYDEYGKENNKEEWPRKEAITAGVFHTSETSSAEERGYALNKSLPQGWYAIEAKTLDKSGDTVKDIHYIEIFDSKAKELAYPQYNWQYYDAQDMQPGDTVHLLTGTAAANVFMIQSVEHSEKASIYNYHHLNGNKETILLPVKDSDKGGFGVSYAFVSHNRIYQYNTTISVPYNDRNLEVTYSTFRNKMEPGSQEKWAVQISGNKGEKVAAELLTAMYDASLDQFTTHSWQAPDIWPSYNDFDQWNSRNNFSYGPSTTIGFEEKNTHYYTKAYDQLITDADTYSWYEPGQPPRITIPQMARSGGRLSFATQGRVMLRGANSMEAKAAPLMVTDGIPGAAPVAPSAIASLEVLKDASATALYGSRAANGVIIVTTKNNGGNNQAPVQIRKNFNETAFFFPQLHADTAGNYTFSFTMPEALTQWKWLSLAHTKDLAFGTQLQTVTTQKTVMAQLNMPRFVRQGDQLALTAAISNQDTTALSGQATLELFDALTNQPVNDILGNTASQQSFAAQAGQSTSIKFPVTIPVNYSHPLTYRLVARAGNFSDGEENTFPVLPNRTLVTETAPLLMKGNTTRQFTLDKLIHQQSNTLISESVTVEYTANPIWQAVQALPYLVEFPHECAEQTFNRFYANALAAFIVNKHPQIKAAFDQWENDTTALQSNLQQNEALKQLLLQETPWVLQAESEAQRKKNIALLFNVVKMSDNTQTALNQLQQMQLEDGSFAWFKGGNADRYITTYIVTGIGKLIKLNAIPEAHKETMHTIATNAMAYLDSKMLADYKRWIADKVKLNQNNLSATDIQYLLARSYFSSLPLKNKVALQYLLQQAKQYWVAQNNYNKALLGVVLYRNGQTQIATTGILSSVLENAVEDSIRGMYWKDRTTCFWHPSPIEHQSAIMLMTAELNQQNKTVKAEKAFNEMRTWLLLNKQTNNWGTTIATADACYALLARPESLTVNTAVTIQLGNTVLTSDAQKQQAGSGYFKQRIDGAQVTPAMGNITVTTQSSGNTGNTAAISYGAVYWQYFEDMDKITVSAANPLSLSKKWFIERQTGNGPVLDAITSASQVKVGDKVVIQVVLKSDRDMDYVHVKDMRAATMEPDNVLSSYKWQDGLGYYEATKDASTNFFIDHLRKGTYVFNYPVHITHTGTFTAGIATAECMYAPEFNSHSEGIKIAVK